MQKSEQPFDLMYFFSKENNSAFSSFGKLGSIFEKLTEQIGAFFNNVIGSFLGKNPFADNTHQTYKNEYPEVCASSHQNILSGRNNTFSSAPNLFKSFTGPASAISCITGADLTTSFAKRYVANRGFINTQADKYGFSSLEAKHGLPQGTLKGVMWQESKGNPLAVSKVGAAGLMQFMPGTAGDMGITNRFDPYQSAAGAAKYLGQLYKRYDGDMNKTLAAYNWGMGNVEKKGLGKMPEETRDYLNRIGTYIRIENELPKVSLAEKAPTFNIG